MSAKQDQYKVYYAQNLLLSVNARKFALIYEFTHCGGGKKKEEKKKRKLLQAET